MSGKIIADTGVWIDFLNNQTNNQTMVLEAAIDDEMVYIGDLILTEVLQGIKNDTVFKVISSQLLALEQVALCGSDIAIQSAINFRKLRKRGITIRKTIDCVIATYCITNKIALLYSDRDFDPFVEHLGLNRA